MHSTKKLVRLAVSGALAVSMLLPSSLAMYQAKVKADALYLRESPGGEIITTLPQDTMVAVLNNSSSWYKVVANGKEGYVSSEFLTGSLTTDFSLGSAKIVCDTTVNFRSQPNTSSSVLASRTCTSEEGRPCRSYSSRIPWRRRRRGTSAGLSGVVT